LTEFEKLLTSDKSLKRKGELDSPLLMGILNITPDSFFDGGLYNSNLNSCLNRAKSMVLDGALILDIGGESSRPGAKKVELDNELSRVLPVIKALRKDPFFDRTAISIDTTKAEVAKQAVFAGANIINDISALKADPLMKSVVLQTQAFVILNHMQGTPDSMQKAPSYSHVLEEVLAELLGVAQELIDLGLAKHRVILDPGIGFGKEQIHNLELIKNLNKMCQSGFEVLLGVSRKSYIAKVKNLEQSNRLQPSIATALYGFQAGVRIFRVHDVKETFESLRMWQAIENLENRS
jgi:dihydropteroate synthase